MNCMAIELRLAGVSANNSQIEIEEAFRPILKGSLSLTGGASSPQSVCRKHSQNAVVEMRRAASPAIG
jgi:hypothetical protein